MTEMRGATIITVPTKEVEREDRQESHHVSEGPASIRVMRDLWIHLPGEEELEFVVWIHRMTDLCVQ